MDFKIVFSLLACVVSLVAYFPYFRDMFLHKTKPHLYTWIIWAITIITSFFGIYYGGGGWALVYSAILCIEVVGTLIFCFKYGTKNITKSDTVVLILALLAIVVWWQLKQPVLSIFMVSTIDVAAYIPSFRKSYDDPWSETALSWAMFAIANIFGILSLQNYNLLTVTYLIAIFFANASLCAFCLIRRKIV